MAKAAARWLQTHQMLGAGVLLTAFVLVYLWPVLIGGEVLSPRSTLFQFAPWASSAPAGWEERTNFILGDVPMSHYPFHVVARDLLRDGVFPAWSQHAYAGVPFFGNPQTVLLSPFALPIWILPLELGIGVAAALKLWVAAFGMYLLVRELRLGFWPGILAAVSYSLSSFSVLWLTHETLLAVSALLPWTVWLVERVATGRGSRLGLGIALALVTAFMFTGGHPGTQVHVLTATAIYSLVRICSLNELVIRERARRLSLIAGSIVLGALLVAVLLVPVLRAGEGTIGVQARMGQNDTIPGAQLGLDALRTALFPDWWGRPSALSLDGPANYNERTFFAGSVATVLALLSLLSPGRWQPKAPFALLGFFGLAIPLHFPGLYWLAENLPILGQVQHQRMMLLYVFAVAVLGAFGLQRLLDTPRERLRPSLVMALSAGVALVALAIAAPSGADIANAAENISQLRHAVGSLAQGSPSNHGTLIATSVGWWLVVMVLAAIAVGALIRWPRRAAAIAAVLVLIAAVDVWYFARDYQPMAPRASIHPRATPAVAFLQRNRQDGRFVGLDGAMLNDWPAIYGLQDLRGTDPPQPDLRWFRLWQVVNPQQLDWAQAMLSIPTPAGLNVLSVLGARYLVTRPDVDARAALPQLRVGYAGPDATVWRNDDAVPRTLVARQVLVTAGETETIATVSAPGFSPRRQVVVEGSEERAATALAGATGPDPAGTAQVVAETNARVTLRARMRRPGLVVLNDRYAPGWTVEIDGRPADAVAANGVMRGVVVPAGDHTIVWSYTVPGLRPGIAVSVAAWVVLAVMVAAWLRRRRGARATGG